MPPPASFLPFSGDTIVLPRPPPPAPPSHHPHHLLDRPPSPAPSPSAARTSPSPRRLRQPAPARLVSQVLANPSRSIAAAQGPSPEPCTRPAPHPAPPCRQIDPQTSPPWPPMPRRPPPTLRPARASTPTSSGTETECTAPFPASSSPRCSRRRSPSRQVQHLHIRLLPQARLPQDSSRAHARGADPAPVVTTHKCEAGSPL